MQIVIDIPEEQIKKSLKESEYVFEDEGIKGFVNIVMQYTNGRLEFVDVERRKDFYSCNFTPLPKGHGVLKDVTNLMRGLYTDIQTTEETFTSSDVYKMIDEECPTIIEESEEEE